MKSAFMKKTNKDVFIPIRPKRMPRNGDFLSFLSLCENKHFNDWGCTHNESEEIYSLSAEH